MENIRVFLDPSETESLMTKLKENCERKANFRRWQRGIRLVPINFVKNIFENSKEDFWNFLNEKHIMSYGHNERLKFKRKIDPEISYFLGWLITDGHIRKGRNVISITQKFREPLEKLKNILIREYLIKDTHFKLNFKRTEWRLEIYSAPLKFILLEYFDIPSGEKHTTIRAPKQIMESDNGTIKSAFLSAVIEGDGHVGTSNQWKGYRYPKIEIIMKNESFLRDIEMIMNSLKIDYTKFKYSNGMFCISVKKSESFEKVYTNIKNFLSHPKKIDTFSNLINQNLAKSVTVK